MYYYIFDLKKCRKNSQVTEIKNYLSVLGISGEYTYPSAAYSIEELVELGLSKKYNTIVGIGGDEMANRIATKLCGQAEAFGFIPLDASSDLLNLIGATGWKDAAESLRYRKIEELHLGMTATGNGFLTSLDLDLKSPTEITLEFRDYLVQTRAIKMTVSNWHPKIKKIGLDYLDIIINSVAPEQHGFFAKISSFLGSGNSDISTSLLRARSFRLFTSAQIPLISNDQVVVKTPQLIESSDEKLRLIVSKKSTNQS